MESQTQDANVNSDHPVSDAHLEDDRAPQEGQFVGATLEIGDGAEAKPHREQEVDFRIPSQSNFDRNRPGSTIGRQSVRSTTSRTSFRSGGFKSDKQASLYFCLKDSAVSKAAEECKKDNYKEDVDGNVTGVWLLSGIDHWDNEREKIVILTENSVLIFKYNFISSKVEEFRRVSLHILDTILVGDFHYPEYSVMPMVSNDRAHGGVQLKWNRGEAPSFGQRWNPWCSTIPWVTFCHHPLMYNMKESETATYNVDDFYESLIAAVSKAYNRKRPGEKVTVIEGPILIESYGSLSSLVFNQSGIGFNKDRNLVCF